MKYRLICGASRVHTQTSVYLSFKMVDEAVTMCVFILALLSTCQFRVLTARIELIWLRISCRTITDYWRLAIGSPRHLKVFLEFSIKNDSLR